MSWAIVNSTLEDWSESYSGPKFHAVLCDPPYGLEFMGKEWDAPHKATSFPKAGNLGGFADGAKPSFARQKRHLHKLTHAYQRWGEALLPHLFPGAIVLMFGGTRTWHHLAVGMENAGFEMWDTLMWLYGQGFPKAQDISKLIDKQNGDEREVIEQRRFKSGGTEYINRNNATQGFRPNEYQKGENIVDITAPGSDTSAPWSGYKTTALKPAWEPILCFKATSGGKTYAELSTEYGSGCLNIEGARIPVTDADAKDVGRVINRNLRRKGDGWGFNDDEPDRPEVVSDKGRYPANIVLDEESALRLDEQSGTLTSGLMRAQTLRAAQDEPGSNCYGVYGGNATAVDTYNDSGGASRFFYVAKADSDEREAGLREAGLREAGLREAGLREAVVSDGREVAADNPYQRGKTLRHNTHPTVKPIAVAKWLATLLLPPKSVYPRRLLIPFAGSGTEIIGAHQAGWDEILGIEQDTEQGYVAIAEARVKYWESLGVQEPLF